MPHSFEGCEQSDVSQTFVLNLYLWILRSFIYSFVVKSLTTELAITEPRIASEK